MNYSAMVQTIRTCSLNELVKELEFMARSGICAKGTGTTRTAYIFHNFVVKIADRARVNESEYNYYCKYKITKNGAPIARTRLYRTNDNFSIILQEKLTNIVQDFSEENYRGSVDKSLQRELDYLYEYTEKDGFQLGKNRNGMYVFFDYNDRW